MRGPASPGGQGHRQPGMALAIVPSEVQRARPVRQPSDASARREDGGLGRDAEASAGPRRPLCWRCPGPRVLRPLSPPGPRPPA